MYFRLHDPHISGEFSPENAKSEPFAEAEIDCPKCGGDGYILVPNGGAWEDQPQTAEEECPLCEGNGFLPWEKLRSHISKYDMEEYLQPGYSCCRTPAGLVEYVRFQGWTNFLSPTTPVVVFDGEEVGEGLDGEPLVIPDMSTVRWMAWDEFLATVENSAA